jgi:luciferase family oxidoreductase group 1
LPAQHPFRVVRAEPSGPFAPEIWVLGSSNYGAQVAAFFGLPYCHAYFFNDGAGAEQALAMYREGYRPSARHPQPHSAVTVWAFAGETQEEADHYYQSRALARLMRDRGQYIALPSPESAAAFALTDIERAQMARVKERALSGTAPDVAARLRALAAELHVDELAITTTAYDPAARAKSYTLLAHEFGLGAARLAA